MLKTLTTPKKLFVAAIALVAITLGTVGTTYALTSIATGTFSDRQYFATNDSPYTIPEATGSGVWTNVPGMVRTVTIPDGTSRLIDARFTAESQCTGGSWCSVRIVTINNATGAITELYPQTGTDFAFDSPSDNWEGHAIERNSRLFLPAGSYRVQVQSAKVGAATVFRLDDMHLAVEAVRP